MITKWTFKTVFMQRGPSQSCFVHTDLNQQKNWENAFLV